MTITTVVYLLSAITVFYTSFCRLTKTTHQTIASVRFGVWSLASVSMASLMYFALWGWEPDAVHAGIFSAIAIVQLSTRRVWRHGVPTQFRRFV